MMPATKLPTTENAVSPQSSPPSQNMIEYWIKIIVGLCIIVLTVNIVLLFLLPKFRTNTEKKATTAAAPISGTVDLNGYIAFGYTIDISTRKVGATDFILATSDIPARDLIQWEWDAGTIGDSYEVKAILKDKDTVIAESTIKTVTAPAYNETLRIVSPANPPDSGGGTTTPNTTPGTQTGVISGKVDINGYIPTNANVLIQAKNPNTNTLITIASIKAADGAAWSWTNAQMGIIYELIATLTSGSTAIGESQSLPVSAPASNEILSITSKAQASSSSESISGIFDINGNKPAGSSVAIVIRKSGTSQFTTVIQGLPTVDGTSWNIPNLGSGTSYDILAYLQVNGQNLAQSQLLVVPAPAHNETLIINSQNRPKAPSSDTISVGCVGKGGNNNNQWQVSIAYNKSTVDQNVKQFILQVGTTGGDSSLVNNQVAPNNPKEPQNYTTNYLFNDKQTYYVQYAYSTCSNCSDINFFSQFSAPVSFSCSTQPSPTPSTVPSNTPYPTYTPYPTLTQPPTPTTIPSDTPSPTPKIAQCNQSCGGSSGYECLDGLTCFDTNPGMIGGDVCRNPNCTDKTDCTCD